MSKNTGTLITSPIRPNDSQDKISVALSNEIQGGLHSYELKSSLSSIIQARRQWGMKVSIYKDGPNNGTYTLKYGWASTTITDDNNWVIDSGGPSELIDSVISVSDGNSISQNDGDRYLVVPTGAVFPFRYQENKISQYSSSFNNGSGGWTFSIPSNGQTLRVDNELNVIYKYQGTWNTGTWVKEYLNQIRYIFPTSMDGLTYSHTTLEQTPLDVYSFSQYESVFGVTNSGTVSLSIDGLGYVYVKKVSSGQLIDLSAGDIVPNVNYTLVYNNGVFQANIQSTTGVIGPAEDGDYTDGLYTDLTSSTPIGTPIDRFNEVLKALVPPMAPNINSWGSNRTGISSKLSFNSTTSGFSSATQSPYGGIDLNGTFTPSSFRLGVFSASGVLTGIINSGVSVHPSTPTPAYAAFSFGQATSGTMSLFLNGSTVSSISLDTQSAINTTGATGGIILSSPTSSKFPSGLPFDQFQNRTGTWQISLTNSGLLDGYNWIDFRHDVGIQSYTVSRFEFVLDRGSTTSVVYSSPIPYTFQWAIPQTKYLSGVQYYNNSINSTMSYDCVVDNLYTNTYNGLSNAVIFRDTTGVFGGPISLTSSIPLQIPILPTASPSASVLLSTTYSLLPNRRRVNETISFSLTTTKSLGTQFVGGTISYPNLFIDTFPPSSTLLVENFDDETYRVLNGPGTYSVGVLDTVSQVLSSTWSSTQSLGVLDNRGLMVSNGRLQYPLGLSYSTLGASNYNPNFGTGLNYTNLATTATDWLGSGSTHRVYTRYFRFNDGRTYTNIRIRIQSTSGITFVPTTTRPLVSGFGFLECKLPLASGKTGFQTPGVPINTLSQATGWLDCYSNYNTSWGNGSGCRSGFAGTSNDQTVTLEFGGSGGTEKSDGYVLVRITLPSSTSVSIDSITITGV